MLFIGLRRMAVLARRAVEEFYGEDHAWCTLCEQWHPVRRFSHARGPAYGWCDNCREYKNAEYRKKKGGRKREHSKNAKISAPGPEAREMLFYLLESKWYASSKNPNQA